jgi:membrane-bound lytic murein transglycosylase D
MLKLFSTFILLIAMPVHFLMAQAHEGTAALPQVVTPVAIPEILDFAGEPVPLGDPEVRERLERELVVACYRHSTTLLLLKRAARWRGQFESTLADMGIPGDFFYISVIESDLDPYADSGKAHGFWQFTEPVAKSLKLEINNFVDQRRDPALSTKAAARHLKEYYSEFNNWTLTAAAYNLGKPTLKRVKDYQNVATYYELYLTPETSRYIFRILAMKLIVENPEKYGFYLQSGDYYQPYATKTIEVNSTIEDIARFAQENKINYKELKIYNPWIKFDSKENYTYRFEVPTGKTYSFQVPVK